MPSKDTPSTPDARNPFHGATQVLDVWHAVEKLASAGRVGLGAGEPFQAWLGQAKGKLVADGYAGACEALGSLTAVAGSAPEACAAAAEALNYFGGHRGRLNYALRLCRQTAWRTEHKRH